MRKNCISCKEEFEGRVDKLYCTSYCKSNFHYQASKDKELSFFKVVDRQLRLNRRLLSHFNKSGKSTIRAEKLINAGFNPEIYTHVWKAKNGNIYHFCFDFGFMSISDNGKQKFLLVAWQKEYMIMKSLDFG